MIGLQNDETWRKSEAQLTKRLETQKTHLMKIR